MSLKDTRDNLVSTFLSEWSDTDVAVQGIKYDPDGDSYVLIQLASTFSEQPNLGRDSGNTWERDIGDCVLSVFTPVSSDVDGLALAEKARLILSQRRVEETITDVGYTVAAGIAPDQRYYLHNVRIPYRTDSVK